MSPRVSLFLLALLIGGCADPKYVTEAPKPGTISGKTSFGCEQEFKSAGYCIGFAWETLPTESSPGILRLRVFHADAIDGFPTLITDDVSLKVALWMPSMGHGSAPTTLVKLQAGTYRVSNMYFVMPGEWEIKFQLLNNGTVADEVVVPFTL